MNILIIDDNPEFLDIFYNKLKLNFIMSNCSIIKLLPENYDATNSYKYDLIFLDIDLNIPGFNGIELAKSIKSFNYECLIVFVSSQLNCIFNSLETQPFYFIRKPFLDNDIETFFSLFKTFTKRNFKILLINHRGTTIPLKTNKIIYIESIGHTLAIKTLDNQTLTYRNSMKNVKKELVSDKSFCQVHKSFLINMQSIKEISCEEIILSNNQIIPIGGKYRNSFQEAYTEYLLLC